MKTLIKFIVFLGTAVAFISCGPYHHVYTNYDKSVDFSRFHTFAWAPDSTGNDAKVSPDLAAYDNDIVRNNAKNYVTHNLTRRGMLVNIDSPDVVFQLVLLNEKKEEIMSYRAYPYNGYYYYNPYYFPYYYPYSNFYTLYGWGIPPYWGNTIYKRTYVKGTVTINMFDRDQKKLIWTGSAEGDIYDPAYIQFEVHPAIDRIMKRFPIKPVSKPKGIEIQKGKIVRHDREWQTDRLADGR